MDFEQHWINFIKQKHTVKHYVRHMTLFPWNRPSVRLLGNICECVTETRDSPSADRDRRDEVPRVSVLLTDEDGLSVRVLVELRLEVDVGDVDDDVWVELRSGEPSSGEVSGEVTGRRHHAHPVNRLAHVADVGGPELESDRSVVGALEGSAFGPPRKGVVSGVVGILLICSGELRRDVWMSWCWWWWLRWCRWWLWWWWKF